MQRITHLVSAIYSRSDIKISKLGVLLGLQLKIGEKFRGKVIKDVVTLPNGWCVIKTENKKSPQDFKVKVVFSLKPLRFLTPKHAHFAIDFYGKLCADREKALKLFSAIIEVWNSKPVDKVVRKYKSEVNGLPGYDLEYILYTLKWILEQEDINFTGRPAKRQELLDKICEKVGVKVPEGRKGSQLAVSVLCDIVGGVHPVEALLRANLDIQPRRKPA